MIFFTEETNKTEQENENNEKDMDPIKIDKYNDFESSFSNKKPELINAIMNGNMCIHF